MKWSACFTLLDFEPKLLPWRHCELEKSKVRSVSKMLDCIIKARQQVKEISKSDIENAVENLEVLFIYHTCQQEDIGITNTDVIMQIIKDHKDGKCRDYLENIKDRKDGKCRDYLENIGSSAYQETVNLYEAYKMLQKLGKEEAEFDPELTGLLEVDSYIIATHKLLMKGLSMKTPGGVLSTQARHTMADGELHEYPQFESVHEARDAIMRIVDRFNMLCSYIKDQDQELHDEKLFVLNMLKCATWLFHQLLSLHPFGDGNGRLCRLILNYVISVLVPFPVPLHDIFRSSRDAYLHAVIAPRKSDGQPKELIRLLIESAYKCCKKFLKLLRVGRVEQLDLGTQTDSRLESTVSRCRFLERATGNLHRNLAFIISQIYTCINPNKWMMFMRTVATKLFSTEVVQQMINLLCQHPEFVRDAVMRTVNRRNMLYFSIKNREHRDISLFIRNILNWATWGFHKLLSLHPLGDGNGELCHLILNYAVNVIKPFLLLLRHILMSSRDAYLNAMIVSRKLDGRLTELIRLLNASDYSKIFLKMLHVSAVEGSDLGTHTDLRNKEMVTCRGTMFNEEVQPNMLNDFICIAESILQFFRHVLDPTTKGGVAWVVFLVIWGSGQSLCVASGLVQQQLMHSLHAHVSYSMVQFVFWFRFIDSKLEVDSVYIVIKVANKFSNEIRVFVAMFNFEGTVLCLSLAFCGGEAIDEG